MLNYLVHKWQRRCIYCKSWKNSIFELANHPTRHEVIIEHRRCKKCLREYEYVRLRNISYGGNIDRHEN